MSRALSWVSDVATFVFRYYWFDSCRGAVGIPIRFTRIARRAIKQHMQANTAPVSSAMGVREILGYVRNTNGGSACFVGTSGPWFPSPGYNETAQMWTGHAAAMGTWWVIVTQGLLYVTCDGLVVGC